METWKPIPQAPDYEISDLANIRRITKSVRNRDYGPIKGSVLPKGYRYVVLRVGPKQKKTFQVHRLVMTAFYGHSDLQVNHINGNKADNRLANLEYVSAHANRAHAMHVLDAYPKGDKHPNSKLTENDVIEILKMISLGWDDNTIGEHFDCTSTNVWFIRKGRAWKHVPRPPDLAAATD